MATLTDIIGRASTLLNDTDPDVRRWTSAELLNWAREALQALVALQPTASTVRRDLVLNGVEHTIPDDTWSLVKPICAVVRAQQSRAVKTWREDQVDSVLPDWRLAAGSATVSAIIFDPADRRTFYTYPPAAAATLRVLLSVVPTIAEEASDFPLAPPYEPIVVDYICYRAMMKDAETAGIMPVAQAYYASFVQALGANQNARLETNPNLDSGPMVPAAIGPCCCSNTSRSEREAR